MILVSWRDLGYLFSGGKMRIAAIFRTSEDSLSIRKTVGRLSIFPVGPLQCGADGYNQNLTHSHSTGTVSSR